MGTKVKADGRLGWEGWFVMALVAAGGWFVFMVGNVVVAIGRTDEPVSTSGIAAGIAFDPVRSGVAVAVAVLLATIAVSIVRSTDWRLSDESH